MNDLVDAFGQLVNLSIASGTSQLRNHWIAGWRPKRPDPTHVCVSEFLDSLDEQQKENLVIVVEHFIECSMFKFITNLEAGMGEYEFGLSVTCNRQDQTEVLISPTEDKDLTHEFFRWRENRQEPST